MALGKVISCNLNTRHLGISIFFFRRKGRVNSLPGVGIRLQELPGSSNPASRRRDLLKVASKQADHLLELVGQMLGLLRFLII